MSEDRAAQMENAKHFHESFILSHNTYMGKNVPVIRNPVLPRVLLGVDEVRQWDAFTLLPHGSEKSFWVTKDHQVEIASVIGDRLVVPEFQVVAKDISSMDATFAAIQEQENDIFWNLFMEAVGSLSSGITTIEPGQVVSMQNASEMYRIVVIADNDELEAHVRKWRMHNYMIVRTEKIQSSACYVMRDPLCVGTYLLRQEYTILPDGDQFVGFINTGMLLTPGDDNIIVFNLEI